MDWWAIKGNEDVDSWRKCEREEIEKIMKYVSVMEKTCLQFKFDYYKSSDKMG